MRSDAARLRARVLLRQRWVAAVALGLVAGVGGGLVLALATIAKDTGSAIDTYVARLDAPEALGVYCPSDMDMEQPDESRCIRYDPAREAASLREHPAVRSVGRGAAAPVILRPEAGEWREAFAWVAIDDMQVYGDAEVVAGRPADPDSAREVMVNEGFLRQHGLHLGAQLDVAPITWEEFTASPTTGGLEPVPLPMQIVGVVRTPTDLTAAVEGNDALSVNESILFLGPGWTRAVGVDHFARYQNGLIVDLVPGADAFEVLRSASPGKLGYASGGSLVVGEIAGLDDAVSYEARAAWAAAGLAALAVIVFVGQMLARQARRELDDADVLRAMGATTGMLVRSSLLRWVLSAIVAVTVAAVLGAIGRGRGPIGVARRMLGSTSIGLDPLVALAALAGLAVLVLGVGIGVTALACRPPRRDRLAGRRTVFPAPPSVAGMAGLAWVAPSSTRERGQVTGVVAGLALAVGAAVASVSVVASLHRLTAEPVRYGAPWHATVSAALGPESLRGLADELRGIDGVAAVGGLVGDEGQIGDHVMYVYAVAPVPDFPSGVQPIITRGRAPASADEVALGSRSLAASGAELGDTVELQYLERTLQMQVVGEVLVYDNWEQLPGVGAVVDDEFMDELGGGGSMSDYVVRFEPSKVEAGVAALRARFPRLVTEPVVPGAVRNLQRVSTWPALLSGLVGLLALAAFVHALLTLVRRQRGQLAILRALGCRRRQLAATVAWYATALVVPAVLIGVPLGVAVGRWGWGAIAEDLGVPVSPVVPLAVLAVVIVAATLLANAAAIPLAWRAGRVDAASALRAE